MAKKNRYAQIIEKVFLRHYKKGATTVEFSRDEILDVAKQIGIPIPKNIGDLVYTFRCRTELPESVVSKAPRGTNWVIRPAGAGRRDLTGGVDCLFKKTGMKELSEEGCRKRSLLPHKSIRSAEGAEYECE